MMGLSAARPSRPPDHRGWALFSPPVDLAAFLGSALLSLACLGIGGYLGLLGGDTPEWAWVVAVLLVDVAHVWATVFRVYADPQELARAPLLYGGVPLGGFLLGVLLYHLTGEQGFWRVLAYIAVFHFVRQQYGWVVLYRARRGESSAWGWRIDGMAVYMATIYPLVYWHAHLPRRFWWFMQGDFTPPRFDPAPLLTIAAALFWITTAVYIARALWQWRNGFTNPGKHLVMATTAICWHVGVITFDSDYAFTVTNVLIHGIPYLVLVYAYGQDRESRSPHPRVYDIFRHGPLAFLVVLWAIAFIEELVWDRAVWHSRPGLFGSAGAVSPAALEVLVPLLALPQLVHYLLDGFVWKRASGPFMERLLEARPAKPGF